MIELNKGGVVVKKYFLFVFCAVLLFVVTGCGNKNQVVCTGSSTEGGINIEAKLVADFDENDKLKDAEVTYDLKDKSSADQYCSLFKLMEDKDKGVTVDCSGSKITIKGYANMDVEEDESDAMIGKTKEEFKKLMEEEEFTCK